MSQKYCTFYSANENYTNAINSNKIVLLIICMSPNKIPLQRLNFSMLVVIIPYFHLIKNSNKLLS